MIYNCPMDHTRAKYGFTLVELSIVLVIIGLLIGGILAAQSMISNTKIGASIRQLQQIDIATSNFKTRYAELPGDFSGLGGVGNDDGQILTGDCGDDDTSFGANQEIAHFYVQLGESGFMPDEHFSSNGAGGINVTNKNVPDLKLAKDAHIIPMVVLNNKCFSDTNNNDISGNKYQITACQQIKDDGCGGTFNPLLEADAQALDSKIDDGVASTGKVGDNDNGEYDTSDPTRKRSLAIEMLSLVPNK